MGREWGEGRGERRGGRGDNENDTIITIVIMIMTITMLVGVRVDRISQNANDWLPICPDKSHLLQL